MLGGAARRPVNMPVVAMPILLTNVVGWGFELAGGEPL